MVTVDQTRNNSGRCSDVTNVENSHKVSLILELHDRLEDQSPATHSQQAAGVLAVGKHSACGGKEDGIRRKRRKEEKRSLSHRSIRQMSVASDGASSSCWNLEDCLKTRMGGVDLQKEKDEAVQHEEVKKRVTIRQLSAMKSSIKSLRR